MAKAAGVRIIPILITGTHRLMPPGLNLAKSGTIYIDILDEIPKEYVRNESVNYENLRMKTLEIYKRSMKRKTNEEVTGKTGWKLPWIIGFILIHFVLIKCLIC